APVRWCKSSSGTTGGGGAGDANVVTGTSGTPATPKCQSKVNTTYRFPRLGNIKRTDIVPATASYGGRFNRTDCAGVATGTCTYTEELQNFANWYSYYRTRMLLMKTASGRAFAPLDDRYRVGFVTINVADDTSRYVKIDKFTPTQKNDWYNKFYSITPASGTPLREALSRVGRHYAGVTSGINTMMPDDPVQYSCQQNFALLTTDGYWNNNQGLKLDGTAVLNQDNVNSGFSTRAAGAFDGALSSSSNTLADVAMYYYKTDLRTTGLVAKNNVPTSAKDTAAHQHMVTFTLGLGLDGLMTYRADYETATTGDLAKIKNGDASGCSWTTGACNWPVPVSGSPSALDDLWHAAVNGRGTYFSAKDPNSLTTGLSGALSAIQIVTGAAASSATSTPNITPTDNFIYSSTYRTVKWDGEVVAEKIDTATGAVIPGVVWSAGAQLNTRVSATSDTRTIHVFDATSATKLKPFQYTNLTAAEQAFFDNKCIPADLPQCGSMNPGDLTQANKGSNLVPWLRGQTKDEGTLYRDRENVLGDTVNAKPAFIGKPSLLYGDAVVPDYASFKAGPAGSRQNVLYIAANDGMLHAFNSDTGAELWAYVPRIVMPDLYKLAANNYDIKHRYYADGSPAPMDVFLGGAWKTILVAGLNSGGRGYYALDVTDPLNPKGLWEVCADPTGTLGCTDKDDNIGFTFGQPIITKRPTDGKWVVIVTSGYNNVTPGDGKGYLFVLDASTGAILDKVDTGVGDTTTPSGFAKIAGFATNFAVDNTTTFIYGGDLLGNVWRFDMSTSGPTRQRIAQLFDGSSPPKPQSVTTRPEITRFDAGFNVVYVGTGRLLGGSDLQDPATLSPPENVAYQQTVYAFKDTGADLGNLRLTGNLVQQTLTVIDSVTRSVSANPVDWSTQNGWYVDLNPLNDSPGERVNIDTQLVKGVLLVVSNEPNSDACSSGGDSFLYQFDYKDGGYVASAPGMVVGTKLGTALTAGFVVFRLPSGQLKYTGIDVAGKKQTGVAGKKQTGGVNPGAGGAIGKRVSWRELIL
ncbi:MAG: pyrrolo-quinoline quinone, partial [Betaproteobacteria bacterium]|nr:pyrrolo-quinoline quinone [Betaproteobacteria bacterium]